MNFSFTEEQEELRKSIKRFLEDKCSISTVRTLMETEDGFDKDVWTQMGTQLGLQGIAIPEEYGGSGFSYVELLVIFEELGRTLACVPFFSTVGLAVSTLLTCDDEDAKKEYLSQIASGEKVATLAISEDSGRFDSEGISLSAKKDGDKYVLSGHKSFVVDGTTADFILVVAKSDKGISLFAVDSGANGLSKESLATMDQTRKQARLEFNNTEARLIGKEGQAWKNIEKALDLAAVCLTAEQVGGAQVCLDTSVEYAKNRIQFGRPIGSFQAIKHKCADMLLQVESARSAAYYAAWAAQEDSDELPVVSSLAKAFCSEAFFHCAAENIQIHGGIGFTWEHDAHLYFKRAKSSELMLGDPSYHRELMLQRLGI